MNIEKKRDLETMTVCVSGRVDSSTAAEFEQQLLGNLSGISRLLLDLAQLEYISSAGLRVLLKAHKTMKSQGGKMSVQGANEEVREVFAITGFLEILHVEDAAKAQKQKSQEKADSDRELSRGDSHIHVRFRKFQSGDEYGIIECIRDEYSDTYFRRNLYDPYYIRTKAENESITFLVAETEQSKIAGFMMLKPFQQSRSVVEIASQIFRKEYRGYHMAEPFFEYAMELLRAGECSTVYCYPVMFHDITQRLMHRLGMQETGLRLNLFDMTRTTHSYERGHNHKQSEGIQVMTLGQRDIGTIYLPAEHTEFCTQIYDRLGVHYEVGSMSGAKRGMQQGTRYSSRRDERQHCLEIEIEEPGVDLQQIMQAMLALTPLGGGWTTNAYLNIRHPSTEEAYQALKKAGFFFTGLKPLCGEREYLIMHHPGEVKVFLEDYAVSEEFQKITAYVRGCMEQAWREKRL